MPKLRDLMPMGQITTSIVCSRCARNYVKNPDNFSDYNEEGILQSYCPSCGYMHPPIAVDIQTRNVSNKMRHRVGTIVAMKYSLPFTDIHSITSVLRSVCDNEFLTMFTDHINNKYGVNLCREEVLGYLGVWEK